VGQLNCGNANATSSGVDQDGLPGLESTKFEEGVVRRTKGDRDTGRIQRAQTFRNGPAKGLAGHAQLGVGTVGAGRDYAVPDLELGDERAHLHHDTGTLITHHVRDSGHVTTEAVQGVATFNADGLDAKHQFVIHRHWIGNLFVTKDVGRSGLVVDGTFMVNSSLQRDMVSTTLEA
jgi:hypothetical protein